MDSTHCRCRRVCWSQRFRAPRQESMDWLDSPAHGRRNRHSGNPPDDHWSIGFACCAGYLDTPNPHSCFVGGVLGILDRSCASDCRRTNLGLCGALGKLGRTTCLAVTSWLAKKLERMVQVDKMSHYQPKDLSRLGNTKK